MFSYRKVIPKSIVAGERRSGRPRPENGLKYHRKIIIREVAKKF
jgi:hypothetical protein